MTDPNWLDEEGRFDPNLRDDGHVTDFDETSADIPIWGWLSGAGARRDAALNRRDQRRAEDVWSNLAGTSPTVDDLSTDYRHEVRHDEYGDLLGERSHFDEATEANAGQLRALEQLQALSDGGYTDADRAAMRQSRLDNAQAVGSQSLAAAQQMQARGMGGGGAELAARMGGGQALANANARSDASMMASTQQRALQALQASGQLSGQIYGQDMNRRSALDDYNQRQMDWRRQRQERNNAWHNRGRESTSQANQTAYENRERQAAGATGQYQAGQSNRRLDAQRQDQADANATGIIGSVLDKALG